MLQFTIAHLFVRRNSFFVFVLVTIILGGGAAFLSGRAIAGTWRPWWQVAAYMLVLGGAVRFFHMALFEGALLSLHYYVVDTASACCSDSGASRPPGPARWPSNMAGCTGAPGVQLGEKKARAKRRRPNPADVSPALSLNRPRGGAGARGSPKQSASISPGEFLNETDHCARSRARRRRRAVGTAAAQIKFGVAGPLTGSNAAFGAQLKNGFEQAIETSTRPAASRARRSQPRSATIAAIRSKASRSPTSSRPKA